MDNDVCTGNKHIHYQDLLYNCFDSMNEEIYCSAEKLGNSLMEQGLWLSTAESCTGGGLGYAFTEVPGSSRWYVGGVIAYCNALKQSLLGVDEQVIELYGAVSEETASEMLKGVLQATKSDIGITTTGIAGPGGATLSKSVGTVCFSYGSMAEHHSLTCHFDGNRQQVRLQSVVMAIQLLQAFMDKNTV